MALTKLHDVHQRRKSRNVGLGVVLGVFVLLVMGLSMAKITIFQPTAVPTQQTQGGDS